MGKLEPLAERFYGYRHWTLEPTPRCFYVGRGSYKRAHNRRIRSRKWKAIVARFGLRVEICTPPITHEAANLWEIEMIVEMKTFTNDYHHNSSDIMCNFTKGGEGTAGRTWKPSEETKRKMAASKFGNKHCVGRKMSDSNKERLRIGRQQSIDANGGVYWMFGWKPSPNTVKKLKTAARQRKRDSHGRFS